MKRNRLFMNGFMRLAAYALMVLSVALQTYGEGNVLAHRGLNPNYIKWQKTKRLFTNNREESKKQPKQQQAGNSVVSKLYSVYDGSDLELIEGEEPAPIDFSYLNTLNLSTIIQEDGGVQETLPEKFDPREKFLLTPVRNQDPQNTDIATCWAWASVGSMETWLAVNGYGQKQFSVKHMINFLGFDLGDDPEKPKGWFYGNAWKAAAYLLRWDGPVWESDDPYTDKSGKLNYSLKSPSLQPVYHVQQMRIVPARKGSLDNTSLKQAIMKFGGLYASMRLYTGGKYWGSRGAYYCDETGAASHAVTLIGWDDNFSRDHFSPNYKPMGNGAFIVKDSYGTKSPRNDGYIYVSYYDTIFATASPCYAFPMLEDINNYARIYQYDELGMVGSALDAKIGYAANVFIAQEDGNLDAVGFHAVEPNERFTITVYTDCDKNNPISGTKTLSQEGRTDAYAGYYTYKLNQNVPIKKGSRFSIVMRLSISDFYPIPVEYALRDYSSGASAEAGQSFISEDGKKWRDLTEAFRPDANFCCKAYTKSATPPKHSLSSISIKLPEGQTPSLKPKDEFQLSCEATYNNNSKKDVTANAKWSVIDGKNYASIDSKGYFKAKDVVVEEAQTVRVQAVYTEDKITVTNKFGFSLATKAPDAPTGIKATAGDEASCVRITWNAAKGATEYAVYRSPNTNVSNAEHRGNVTDLKFCDTDAVPGVDYWYFVKAKNTSGSSSMDNVGVKGWRKLSPPNVTASDNLTDKVEMKWNESAGAKAYRVYRSETMDGVKSPLSGWQTVMTYQDKNATPGKTYYYYVIAAVDTNGTRPSDYSIVEDGKIVPPVTVNKLNIKGPAMIESGKSGEYTVSVAYSDQSSSKDVTAQCSWYNQLSGYATFSGAGTAKVRVTAKTVTERKTVKLIAFYTENGKSISCTNDIAIVAANTSAPTGLKVTSQTTDGVGLSWASVNGAVSYKVYRAIENETAKAIGSSTSTSYTDTAATPGVTYKYSVTAINGAGESSPSVTVTATVPLSAPANVTVTSSSEGVNVSWRPSTGATYYRVSRSASSTGTKTDLGAWQTTISYLDTTAVAGTTYYYFVRAATSSSGANASAYSDPVSGKRVGKTLSSISISGADKVAAGNSALYTCTAMYGSDAVPVTPQWSATPTTAATIDATGKLTAKSVSSDTTVTISASFTDGTTKTASKTITVSKPTTTPTATVQNLKVASRWPFASMLDIDYTLATSPSGTKATVKISARDEDHGVDIPALTLTGDGADGSYISAGTHRLTWNIGADYPDFHAKALSVTLVATPAVPAQNVTITFNGNGGTPSESSRQYTAGSAYGSLPTASRTGYTSSVWWTVASGGTQVTTASTVPASATTLYAHWTANTYSVSYTMNGGTKGTSSPTSGTYDTAFKVSAPTKSGSTFVGWTVSSGLNTSTAKYGMSSTSQVTSITSTSQKCLNGATGDVWFKNLTPSANGSVTLTANWTVTPTYTVTYLPGSNGTGTQQTATKTKDVALTLKGATFTRTGYTQTGWATSDGGSKAYNLSASYTANAAITLYPFWTANTYTVTLDPQGGSGGTASVTATYASAMPAITVPTWAGHTFGGYWTAANGSGTQYYTASGASARNWDKTSATTLYAKWTTNTYTVTYSPGVNGTGTQQTDIKTHGVSLTLRAKLFTRPNSSSCVSYSQTGWAVNDGGAKVYELSGTYTANASTILYPYWAINVNMTPLRNVCAGIAKLDTTDGGISDTEMNKALTNPHYCDLDGNPDTISAAEKSILQRIAALNQGNDKSQTVIGKVMAGDYSSFSDATLEELGGISSAIYDLRNQ